MHSTRLLLVASMWAFAACTTDIDLEDAGHSGDGGVTDGGNGTGDGGVTADAGTSPLKLLFIFDASRSAAISDPNGERVLAMTGLLEQLPVGPETSFAVMAFAGSLSGWLNEPLPAFTPLTSLTPLTKSTIATRVLTFSTQQSPDAGGDVVDWVRGLDDAWTLLYLDAMSALTNGTPPKARYVVFFISDGHPTFNQDDSLLCGDVVRRIRNLRLYAEEVTFNTIHVFKPSQPLPTCAADAGLSTAVGGCLIPIVTNPGTCPTLEVDLDAVRLNSMATLGGGAFRDFRAGQTVNYVGLIP